MKEIDDFLKISTINLFLTQILFCLSKKYNYLQLANILFFFIIGFLITFCKSRKVIYKLYNNFLISIHHFSGFHSIEILIKTHLEFYIFLIIKIPFL